ncbi:S-adenosyl-L-methionine-dependent methyltransferase [Gloeophyllum trabeum ATCC 11539]|uniref:S-adenosyl-L-methionine-dependent methyltransferase n=1 Tax=Gloeophyllum trabeum (strain ATCC 11539 / FP-39264 / Madison 617) TaxID=670483 RepID=S7QGF1_GLOTA|nr:S-adenosyl-L-methionine-dependent methyltransferase [Gloeophyllum trabeum ATCC 11539]EPQ58263.1 S-adenosyl-L-methionine-dependent methyltransferase [Gloeophyllum trabeum ATCC 11539]
MPTVHDVAKQGFGTDNELYDRARPSYQPEALSYIRQAVQASPVNVVELGSGTGIFTRALLAHPEWSASLGRLRAIEPSEGMRDVFTKTVKDERVTTSYGTFDTTGVEDGWADIVIVAQAFHWCPDYNAAAAEFARILKPAGVVALIWNLEDRDKARWVAQLRDRVELHEKGTPQFRLGLWRETFSTPNYNALFEPPIEKTWDRALPGTVEIAVERACSKSYIVVLPEDEKKKVAQDVTNIVKNGDDMIWIDKEKGVFEYPYRTYVVLWRKK